MTQEKISLKPCILHGLSMKWKRKQKMWSVKSHWEVQLSPGSTGYCNNEAVATQNIIVQKILIIGHTKDRTWNLSSQKKGLRFCETKFIS